MGYDYTEYETCIRTFNDIIALISNKINRGEIIFFQFFCFVDKISPLVDMEKKDKDNLVVDKHAQN